MLNKWNFLIVLIIVLGFYTCVIESPKAVQPVKASYVEFMGMPSPQNIDEMATTYTAAKVRVYIDEQTYTEHSLHYNTLFNVKDKVGRNQHPAGQLYNYKMEPILDPFGKPVIAETPDANSLLNVEGKLFLVTHYEYDWLLSNGNRVWKQENWYSRMPMGMTLTSIEQGRNGQLKAIDQKPIDFSSVDGLWIPCFGSQTPWNTHLGSEEDYDLYYNAGVYEARREAGVKALSEVYFDNTKEANPYHYGYITEVEVKKDASYHITKHYAMGKGTWEMAKVLDDGRTAYFGDDGKHVGMFMFVADKKDDLSSGTLYAAKWMQTSPDGSDGGEANLRWLKLGHASNTEVKAYADAHTFSDIFEHVSEVDANGTTPQGYTKIRAGHNAIEYLKLKEGKENVAAFLEPRRYAAYIGATTEWNKMEGITFDPAQKRLYMAMSYIKDGMIADEEAPRDDIRLQKNNCGATYALQLSSGQKDQHNKIIDSVYVATKMQAVKALLGKPLVTKDHKGNTCEEESVANVDNIFFSDKMRTLFIGEDSSTHVNNFLWAYNVDNGKLARLLSTPSGAESTGLQVIENENGDAYIMSNAQHLGDFTADMNNTLKETLRPKIDRFSAPVGYIGGIPGLE